MYKNASPTKSVVDFAKTLKKGGVRSNIKSVVDNALLPDNSGSMILDFLSRGKVGNSKTYKSMQRKAVDIDMKLGGKAYDFLDSKKGKIAGKLKNTLVENTDVLKAKGTNGAPDSYLRVQRAGLLNPINKVKNSVVPFVGSMTIANHLLNKEDKKDE